MRIKEKDLVMLRLKTDYGFSNTWFRVMFVDTDETFIGRTEKVNENEFDLYKLGEDIRLDVDKVQRIYKKGEQWCYSDNINICDCPGLCRNK